MRGEIVYQWDWEEIDEFGDIIDHNHSDVIEDITDWMTEGNEIFELVLVRDVWNKFGELTNRQWAYVENNQLPNRFDGGASIPKKYIKQFEQWSVNK